LTELTDRFNESQDQYYVHEEGQGGYGDLNQAFTNAAVAGELPTMSQLTPTDVPELATNDLLVPLTDEFLLENGFSEEALEDIYPGFLESSTFEDTMYAMPFSKSTRLMFYNQGILDEYGVEVPTTWDEVVALGEMMVENGDDRHALGLEEGFSMEVETLARQNGSNWVDDQGTVELNTPETTEAFEFFGMLLEENYARTAGEDGYMSGPFGRGEAALYIGSSAGIAHVIPVAEDIEWGTTVVPTWNDQQLTLFAGNDLGLFSSASEEEQEAFVAYMNFLLEPENTAFWASRTGYVPLRESALESEEWTTLVEEEPIYEAPTLMLEDGMTSPTFEGYGTFRNAVLDTMDNIYTAGNDVNEELDQLQETTEGLFN
jgi:multiple sugar transport system substrate-binding protein